MWMALRGGGGQRELQQQQLRTISARPLPCVSAAPAAVNSDISAAAATWLKNKREEMAMAGDRGAGRRTISLHAYVRDHARTVRSPGARPANIISCRRRHDNCDAGAFVTFARTTRFQRERSIRTHLILSHLLCMIRPFRL